MATPEVAPRVGGLRSCLPGLGISPPPPSGTLVPGHPVRALSTSMLGMSTAMSNDPVGVQRQSQRRVYFILPSWTAARKKVGGQERPKELLAGLVIIHLLTPPCHFHLPFQPVHLPEGGPLQSVQLVTFPSSLSSLPTGVTSSVMPAHIGRTVRCPVSGSCELPTTEPCHVTELGCDGTGNTSWQAAQAGGEGGQAGGEGGRAAKRGSIHRSGHPAP